MARAASLVCLSVSGSSALLTESRGTPVDTVLDLLKDLQADIKVEGKKEAESYEKFGCFCKDKTKSRSRSIKEQQDTIDERTATIEEETKTKEGKEEELQERKEKQEKLKIELDDEIKRCKKEKIEYTKESEDLKKALSSLKKAKKALKDSKGAALLQGERSDVSQAIDLADALGFLEKPQKKVAGALMQVGVDPDDPEYKFHSDELIKLLTKLQADFQKQNDDLDAEWKKTKDACDENKKSLNEKIDSNQDKMDTLEEDIGELKKTISQAKNELEEAEGILADDSLYLKDLTMRCQHTATEYDQRTSMRFEELEALKKATKIIKEDVKDADSDANKRALLLAKEKPSAAPKMNGTVPAHTEEKRASKPLSFLQTTATQNRARLFLQRVSRTAITEQDRQAHAAALLKAKGLKLQSTSLTALAERVQGNPFKKIKKLIQNLIERLLAEAKAEATKKGFCDTELGKAYKERDTRFAAVRVLMAEIGQLSTTKQSLEDEIEELGADVKQLKADLKEAEDLREEEHDENSDTLKTAKGGLEAVTKALKILKEFYKKASKAALLQSQASPVDEDTEGPGFSGSSKGNQGKSKGIIGMLEVIQSDFDRTIRHTTQSEAEAAGEFVQFDRTSKSDIAGKETKTELNEQEHEATKKHLNKKREDLEDEQDLLDDVLKAVEELKPTCLDSGMSYQERVEKREEEISALTDALCILDAENVEDKCK